MTPVGVSALHVVVLAAGKGTRMKSARPKVLHALAGRPLIAHVLRAVAPLGAASTIIVVGHEADEVKQALAADPAIEFVTQTPQLGTGHALLQAEPPLRRRSGTVLLIYADVPLLRPGTLERLVDAHRSASAAATVLTCRVDNPFGYGRIVRDDRGRLERIVEERDASAAMREIKEINSGIYAFDLGPLFTSLRQLGTNNSQGEYYLTDLIAAYYGAGRVIETVTLDDPNELRGVNSRVDLADLSRLMRDRKNRELMLAGVTLEDPATTFIDLDVTIGIDTIVGPGVHLQGDTHIGQRCHIHAGSRLTNATLADEVRVLDHTVVVNSAVGAGASVGPFSHLRPGSIVGQASHIGNFVELKNTTLGPSSKAGHLAYLGDATIGAGVNIGAGTITCNYDGETKNPTTIDDGVFIGSDSQLIAPVRIGKDSYVAAGSTISVDVPEGALAISRGRQENKPGWVARRKEFRKKKD
jgi:bifunctional UDP-N-acetylglucosamine pyrophosphorylase / glucosamine-1-phosphate N-acetyltransferase